MVAELAYAHDSKSCSCIRIVGSIPTTGTITETPHGRSRATGYYAMIMSKNYFQPSIAARQEPCYWGLCNDYVQKLFPTQQHRSAVRCCCGCDFLWYQIFSFSEIQLLPHRSPAENPRKTGLPRRNLQEPRESPPRRIFPLF